MKIEDRHLAIASWVAQHGTISVEDVVDHFGVSPATAALRARGGSRSSLVPAWRFVRDALTSWGLGRGARALVAVRALASAQTLALARMSFCSAAEARSSTMFG